MSRTPSQTRAAFTLLEVMLAVSILAIIMTAVYSTWNAGLMGWKRTVGVSDNFQRQRIVMSALDELTKSLVYAASKNGLYDVRYERDSVTGDVLSFVTASEYLLPASEAVAAGMRRVNLGLQRDESGRPFLAIANSPALIADAEPELTWHSLCAEVSGFAVRFRDPRNGGWADTWEESNLIPSAIEYTIAFGTNDRRLPPMIVTRSIELPVAQYALQLLGQTLNQNNTTNTVTRRDLELVSDDGRMEDQ
jgi:prepilin-type N-terminal cleavage/methylation domain-containing protein